MAISPAAPLPGASSDDRRRDHPRFRLVAAQGEAEQRVGTCGRDDRGIAGHARQFVRLQLSGLCGRQPSGGPVDEGAAEGECRGQPGQRSAVAGTVDPGRWSAAPPTCRRADRPPQMVASPKRSRATSGSTSSARRAWIAPRNGGTAAAYPPVARAVQPRSSRSVAESGGSPVGGSSPAVCAISSRRAALGRPPGEHGGLQRGQQRVLRRGRVERPQSSCRTDQVGGGLGHVPTVEPDPAPQPCRLRGGQRITQAFSGLAEQNLSPVDRPGKDVGLCCRQMPLGSPLLLRRQQRRAFQQRGRGGAATTARRPLRCRLQRGGDAVVGPGGGRGEMPGPGNYVELRIARRRQGLVGLPPLDRGRGVVDRRSDKWMGELHLWPEDHQSGGLRRHRRRLRDAQRGPRPPQATASARLVRRRQQQQPLRVRGQSPAHAVRKPFPAGDRRAAAQARAPAHAAAPVTARGRLRSGRADCPRFRRRCAARQRRRSASSPTS